jgi:hypothetical protein
MSPLEIGCLLAIIAIMQMFGNDNDFSHQVGTKKKMNAFLTNSPSI